ncbi:hypothetical protein HWV62_41623 [Athelia sp. TMB]|nr:hypothetical protein HWV62_41623 [Athelia sp. TMB]
MFTTSRLTLRACREADMPDLIELANTAAVQSGLTWSYVVPNSPKQISEEILKHNEQCLISCIVTLTATGDFMGFTKMWPTSVKNRDAMYGIGLKQEYWGQGYGTEITEFMVDYAFRWLNMHRVSLTVFEHNTAAITVYKKVGFVMEGTARKTNWVDGKWQDIHGMGILDTEWAERAASRGTQSKMFTTSRLTLRAYREADMADLLEFNNCPAVQRSLTGNYIVPHSPKFSEEILKRNEQCIFSCIVTLTATGEFMGFAKLWPTSDKNRDAMYAVGLKQEYWGKGYGTEITEFTVDYAFRGLNMHRVSLMVSEHNAAAIVVYKKV